MPCGIRVTPPMTKPGRCCQNNCQNPQAPEFGKCWKGENNVGCCGNCGTDDYISTEGGGVGRIRVVKSHLTRSRVIPVPLVYFATLPMETWVDYPFEAWVDIPL